MGAKQLGKNVKEAREKAGLTQEELAEKIGLHASSVSRIERGVANPTHSILDSIRKLLKMDASEIFPH